MIVKGQKIDGRYQIIRNIGEGGMANVYLAYDTILERQVAVKILRGDLANDEKFVKRFQREAKAASSLNHPNIVEMYDVGEDNGNYFIVMEYIDGRTLKSLIKKRGALSLTEVVDIMLQLTSAIACAHDSYIIHRDIKPQNVLILEDGRVKITDFGIAIALNSAELTQTNSVMGSVHYLPPEQANGNGATIKSDIYSLGILMYELLTGSLPFKGENAVEIALKQMKDSIPSVCEKDSTIPQSIENIVLRACAKNPKNRYDSVSEMHHDLKIALLEENKNCERVVYQFPEHDDLEATKTLPTLANISEITNQTTDNDDKKSDDDIDLKDDKQIKWTLIIVGVLTSLLIIIIAIVSVILIGRSRNKSILLPVISSMTGEEAQKELNKLGIDVIVKEEESSEVDEGNVIGYLNKKEGITKVKKGSTVTIIVSSGEAGVVLEDYTGKNVEVVKLELTNLGIKVVTTQKKIDEENYEVDGKKKEVFEGMIVGQDKKKGTRLEEGGVIELYYAVLIATYPDFTSDEEDYDKEKIQTFCDDNEITCVFEEVETDSVAPGTILSQNRSEGVEVKPGVSLKIEIAAAVPKYDVSFNTNGGAPSISKQTIKKGESAVEPATKPTKTGYEFAGWYLNGMPYNFSNPVSENIQLEAKWNELKER